MFLASFCSAQLRAEFVKNVPRTVNLITAEQQSFVQQQIDSIDYKDDNGWEKLDKDSSVFLKLSKKHNKGESNSWGKVSERSERTLWKTRNIRATTKLTLFHSIRSVGFKCTSLRSARLPPTSTRPPKMC